VGFGAGFGAIVTLLALDGCGRPTHAPLSAPQSPSPAADAGYLAPPAVTAVRRDGAEFVLEGRAAPKAQLRLGDPAGETWLAQADARGDWTLRLPRAGRARIFGLSMRQDGRVTQAQGYLLAAPSGEVAQLRAGAGAAVLSPGSTPRLTALDFDQEGGAVVSGVAPAGAAVSLAIDGRVAAGGRADASGRLALVLTQPLRPGAHRLAIAGEGFQNAATVAVAPHTPLSGAPYRTAAAADGLRVDWITPGGGVQSTLLLN